VRGKATLVEGDMTEARRSIAGRHLGAPAGERFAADRAFVPGILLRLAPETTRAWDLSAILPG
jgi:hypothetical protein